MDTSPLAVARVAADHHCWHGARVHPRLDRVSSLKPDAARNARQPEVLADNSLAFQPRVTQETLDLSQPKRIGRLPSGQVATPGLAAPAKAGHDVAAELVTSRNIAA